MDMNRDIRSYETPVGPEASDYLDAVALTVGQLDRRVRSLAPSSRQDAVTAGSAGAGWTGGSGDGGAGDGHRAEP